MQCFKIALCIVTASLWLVQTAHADDDWFNQPRGFNIYLNSVVDIQNNGKDDDKVMIKGRLTNYLGKDNYEFTDINGDRIEVELDDDADWSVVHRDQLITIAGSLDKNMFTVKVDAKHFIIASLQEQQAFQATTAQSTATNQSKGALNHNEDHQVALASSSNSAARKSSSATQTNFVARNNSVAQTISAPQTRSAIPVSEPVQLNAYSHISKQADPIREYQTNNVTTVQTLPKEGSQTLPEDDAQTLSVYHADNIENEPAENGTSVSLEQRALAQQNTYIEPTVDSGITTTLSPTTYTNQITPFSPQATFRIEASAFNIQSFTADESGNSYLMLNSNTAYPPTAEIISVSAAPISSKYSQKLYVSGSFPSVVNVQNPITLNSENNSQPQAQYMHSFESVAPMANPVVFQSLDESAAINTLQLPAAPAAGSNNLPQAIDNTILDIHSQMQHITPKKP